ncbi:hypothetical protein C4J81_10575 [Deltaproteobacteria bacterium Smac51]|nr:hypothetical protein C4J81_10575 [Deltaproteobacteria bacterium Smac51]
MKMTLACENCGHEPRGRTCSGCAETAPVWAKFCPHCGAAMKSEERVEGGDPFSIENRRSCPDGNCIGILDADGRCVVCGKVG